MNQTTENMPDEQERPLEHQGERLQELIGQMLQCCQERMLYQSKRFDLPPAELKCLMLFGQERYLTVKGIALKLDVAKSRVTKILDGMEKRGLITRDEDPRDARVRLIGLTAEGRRRCEEVAAYIRDMHQKILTHIPPGERQGVFNSLESLRSAMELVKQLLPQG